MSLDEFISAMEAGAAGTSESGEGEAAPDSAAQEELAAQAAELR